MNIKEEAYKFHMDNLSYKEIADKLGISKTRAFEYVKEVKLIKGIIGKPVPNVSELNSERSERNSGSNSERKETRSEHNRNQFAGIKETTVSNTIQSQVKQFTGDELMRKKFKCLEFTGKFLELIGKPEKIFSAVIWGLPKGGKSNFAIRFADYLQEFFGRVLYIAAEEGASVTLQNKIRDIGGSRVTFRGTRDRGEIRNHLKSNDFDFVFIDSINNADIDNDFMEFLKKENPKKSFIAIAQATKSGNFKGDQALTHNCDFIIKVEKGIAYHQGRFGSSSEVEIFKEPLYSKKKGKGDANKKGHKTIYDKLWEEVTPSPHDTPGFKVARAGLKLLKKYSTKF